jgi:hypothetical protein
MNTPFLKALKHFFQKDTDNSLSFFKQLITQVLLQDPILSLLHQHLLPGKLTPELVDSFESFHFPDSTNVLSQLLVNTLQHCRSITLKEPYNTKTNITFPPQAYALQNYLISKSLMDCSLLIRFSSKPHSGLKSLNQSLFYYGIGLVDVEPKSPFKIPFYSQQQQECQLFYKENNMKRCTPFHMK